MKKGDYQSIKQAGQYHNLRFRNIYQVNKDEISLLENWLKDTTFKASLDLGAGTGRIIKILLKYHPKIIYALDQSEAMLAYLGKLYKKEVSEKKIKLIQSYANKTPVKSSSLDLVTAFHLFKHFSEIKTTLAEIQRVLKPKGCLIFDASNRNSIIRFNLGTCFALTQTTLEKKLEENGFKIKEIKYMHIFGETIYNIPFGKYLIHRIDKLLSFTFPKSGTKIFILAEKI